MTENNSHTKKQFYFYDSKIIFPGKVVHNKQQQSELSANI